ncbi:MAG: MFS transporter, partial [Planctomycetota bacterium]|nr:MFS transporter [Planctomycetota bacterium]
DDTQVGQIFGVGLWPFAISIVLFSLFIDRIGYKISLWFAVLCHVIQAFMLITAGMAWIPETMQGYWWLWIGSFVGALGNGTVEAVINPVIATVYREQKTKWLTILHAGWPGGLVLAGLLALSVGEGGANLHWRFQVGVLLFPVVIYAFLLIRTHFPINERVAAGIPYLTMLKQAGFVGAFIILVMVVLEIGRVFEFQPWLSWSVIGGLTLLYALVVRGNPGRALFIVLLLLMIPLATTELGTDAWIKDLIGPALANYDLSGTWVLIYTAFVMTVLRVFLIGPLSRVFSPLAILAICSAFAAVGIFMLAGAEAAAMILVFATIYGIGQSFFWPVTLGVVSEQFPEGGALTLNSIAAVGMLGVGIIGAPLLGNLQDNQVHNRLQDDQAIYAKYVDPEEKQSIFGAYRSVDQGVITQRDQRIEALEGTRSDQSATFGEVEARELEILLGERDVFDGLTKDAKASALRFAAGPAVFMFLSYVVLILWFKSRGGYRPVELSGAGGDHTA